MFARVLLLVALSCGASARMAYQLPASARDLLQEPLQENFSCEDLPYGYYADVENNCQVFHICVPIADDIGALVDTTQFTFSCGAGTIFNQESLTCNHEALSPPCANSPDLYRSSNQEFGRTDDFVNEV